MKISTRILNFCQYTKWRRKKKHFECTTKLTKKKRKTIILVFRGSVSRRDWATDIDFIPTKYRPIVQDDNFECEVFIQQECINCKVHRGFYNFLKDNSGAIISLGIKLKKIYPDYQFLIIGHSLGAAFTTLSGI